MQIYPTNLELSASDQLVIDWSDGTKLQYRFAMLREACPCATCREKRVAASSKPADLLPVITQEEALPIKVVGMKPVGNYAYTISFSDGHDTGIYSFELLRELGEDM